MLHRHPTYTQGAWVSCMPSMLQIPAMLGYAAVGENWSRTSPHVFSPNHHQQEAHVLSRTSMSCVFVPLEFSNGTRMVLTSLGLNVVQVCCLCLGEVHIASSSPTYLHVLQLLDTNDPFRFRIIQEIYLPPGTHPHVVTATQNGTLLAVSTCTIGAAGNQSIYKKNIPAPNPPQITSTKSTMVPTLASCVNMAQPKYFSSTYLTMATASSLMQPYPWSTFAQM